jgi:hypothetical protein
MLFGLVGGAVEVGHPHAAEAYGGDRGAALAKRAGLQGVLLRSRGGAAEYGICAARSCNMSADTRPTGRFRPPGRPRSAAGRRAADRPSAESGHRGRGRQAPAAEAARELRLPRSSPGRGRRRTRAARVAGSWFPRRRAPRGDSAARSRACAGATHPGDPRCANIEMVPRSRASNRSPAGGNRAVTERLYPGRRAPAPDFAAFGSTLTAFRALRVSVCEPYPFAATAGAPPAGRAPSRGRAAYAGVRGPAWRPRSRR